MINNISAKTRNNGFTLIELLVVISIIGFIVSFAVYDFNKARMQVKATRIASDFITIEKALNLLMDKENMPKWWLETEKSTDLKNFSGLAEFIKMPTPPIAGSYVYDNDGDTLVPGCCGGVNIGLFGTCPECLKYFDLVDKIIDNGDGRNYGKVRGSISVSHIVYNMSPN